jgi:hypothetical protein
MAKFNLNTITSAIALVLWTASVVLSSRLLYPPTVCVVDSEHRLGDSLIYFNSSGRIAVSHFTSFFPPDRVIPFTQVGHGFTTFPPGTFFRCERLLGGEIVAVSGEWAPSAGFISAAMLLFYSAHAAQLCMYLALLFRTRSDTKKKASEDRPADPPAPTPPSGRNPNVHVPPGLEGSMYE